VSKGIRRKGSPTNEVRGGREENSVGGKKTCNKNLNLVKKEERAMGKLSSKTGQQEGAEKRRRKKRV